MRSRMWRAVGLGGALVLGAGWVSQARVAVQLLSTSRTVAPGDVAIHAFSISNPGLTSVEVTLSVEVPLDWGQLGVPAVVRLSAGDEDTVFVTAIVPRTAPAGVHAVTLRASWDLGEARATGEVRVRSVASIALSPPASGATYPGDAIAYLLTVTNRGNVLDRVFVDATSAHGWPVRTTPREVTLRPGESGTVELVLSIPAHAEPGRDLFSVMAQSAEGAETRTSWYTNVLPPGPDAIVGTIFSRVEMIVGGRLGYDPITGRRLSFLSLSGDGAVLGGALDMHLLLTGPWGPAPYTLSRFSLLYQADHAWAEVGEVGLNPSSLLLSLGGHGMAGGVASEYGTVAFLTGWQGDEGRFGLRGAWFGAWGELGLAYRETRGSDHVRAGTSWVTGKLGDGFALHGEGGLALSGSSFDAGFRCGLVAEAGTELVFQADAYAVGPWFPSPRADRAGISLSGQLAGEPWGIRFTTRWERDNLSAVSHVPTVVRSDLTVALDWTSPGWPVALFGNLSLRRSQGQGPGFSLNRGIRVLEIAAVIGDAPLVIRLTGRWRWEENVGAAPELTGEYGQRFHLSLGQTRATLSLTQAITRRDGATVSSAAQISLALRTPAGVTADLWSSRQGNSVGVEVPFALSPALSATIRVDAQWDTLGNATSLNATAGFQYAFVVSPPFLPAQGWVEGIVFIDEDGNGRFDLGERGVAGAVLALASTSVSSGSDGRFLFPPVSPGAHDIALIELPSGLQARTAFPLRVEAVLAGRTAVHIPCERLGQIHGLVFDDADRSGSRAEGEAGLARVRVILEQDRETIAEVYTNPLGAFAFADLGRGEYTVRVVVDSLPDRYELTMPAAAAVSVVPGTAGEMLFGAWSRPRPVVVVYQPPVADFEWLPRSPRAGEPIEFDAGVSLGRIVAYDWDFAGDGKISAQASRVMWTFPDPGVYLVTLRVTDDAGLIGEAARLVQVAP